MKNTIKSTLCTRRTLAANDFMLVEHCTCGSVHLTIGAVTLRFASAAIPSIATTLADAASVLVLDDVLASRRRDEVLS